MLFHVEITGDMTLSILNDKNIKVLGIDMLSKGTMRAGTNGDLLARALNDLTLIQEHSQNLEGNTTLSCIEGINISPRPWACHADINKKRLSVYDNQKKQIAAHTFSKKTSEAEFLDIAEAMQTVIESVNRA